MPSYPGRRYYGGCEQVDRIETIARERAKSLFGAEYVNVQPHSGAQANAAVYQALVKPGDTVLGLALDHGGHLTHGMKINFSGRFYHAEATESILKPSASILKSSASARLKPTRP